MLKHTNECDKFIYDNISECIYVKKCRIDECTLVELCTSD